MPVAKRCTVEGCPYPKAAPKHRCVWHVLAAEPPEEQVERASLRLGMIPPHLRKGVIPSSLWPPGMRWCSGCQTFVPTFYARGSQCKACAGAKAHARHIHATYGIDLAAYMRLKETQGGVCAICAKPPKTERLAVDHDHHTGRVRGLLCSHCNHDTLTAIRHDVAVARRLVAYLEHPPFDGDWDGKSMPSADVARRMSLRELSEFWQAAERAYWMDEAPF